MSAKMSRKERELAIRRQEVLEVALELFVEKGFEQTSMAEIAQQADFAVGTLYTLFKDKNDLYQRLILDGITEFEQALSAALDGPGNEVERLERYIRAKISKFVERSALARLYFSQVTRHVMMPLVGTDRVIQTVMDRTLKRIETTLRAAMRKKLILKMDPRMLTLGFEGLSNAYLVDVIERPGEINEDAIVRAIMKILRERVILSPDAS